MICSTFLIASAISAGAFGSPDGACPAFAQVVATRLLADEQAQSPAFAPPPAIRASVAPRRAKRGEQRPTTIARVAAAGRVDLLETAQDGLIGAAQVQPWSDGGVYRLYTAPEQVSDIALQAGERLISVAAGDTARWVIGDTTSGAGTDKRTHILVKPSAAGLRTNLVIATDRRVYHVELESRLEAPIASISWTYAEDALLALRPAAEQAEATALGVAVEALNFNYRIEGHRPQWRPLRAFDDGRQVYIQFPTTIGEGEAPPLFLTGEGGRTELVNYRQRGHYYIVDRLFDAAELRLGERRQQIVRIVRESPALGRGRS